jgi:hypothetical protein
MRKAIALVVIGSMCALACGGVKGIENSGKKLGDDVADSSVTKDVEDAGTGVGNDVADASVTKDVSDGANKVGDDTGAKKDAGTAAPATKPKGGGKKPKPKKP